MLTRTLMAAAMAAVLALPGVAGAGQLDLSTAEGVAKAMRKIQCSLEDEKPITYWWHGRAYSRMMGVPDKLLFNVEGMNVRQCATVRDENGNYGFRLVSREILLYKDPVTNEVLRTWENPFTGEEVEVLHVANDPVNSRPNFGLGRNGEAMPFPGTQMDGRWWLTFTVPLYYENPLGGDYQVYVGGTYRATEMFNFLGDTESLLDDTIDTANVQVGWVRHSDWLPWMKMSGREGIIYMHTAGKKLESWDDMSDTMKAEIAANYPEYTDPPPVDDDRENETSWTYFKKVIESRGGPEPLRRQ